MQKVHGRGEEGESQVAQWRRANESHKVHARMIQACKDLNASY